MANLFRVNTVKLSDGSSINSGILYNANSVETVDFNNLILTGGNWIAQGISSVNTGVLTGIFASLISSNKFNGSLNSFNTVNANSVNINGPLTVSGTAINFSSPSAGIIYDGNNNALIGFIEVPNTYTQRGLFDDSGNQSLSFTTRNRSLIDFNNTLSLDWGNRLFSGNWNVGTGTLSVQGNLVVTANQTGGFGGSTNTGQLTGVFYPLVSNPSNYITASQTGIFITTGQTGSFGGGGNTGQLTGAFYPLNSNPSNYITSNQTGNFVTTGQTGLLTNQFYPLNTNPSNYITSGQTGIFVTTGNTGSFITSIQTGAFASTFNLQNTGTTLQNEINSINNGTGNFITLGQIGVSNLNVTGFNLTGNINITGISGITVITGNSSQLIIGINTGLFYSSSNPNNYVNSTQTGSLTGQFYPLNTNPSGYITSSQTGTFASNINLQSTGFTLQTEINTLNNLTGNFILTGQTGAFASVVNLQSTGSTLQTLINSLNTWTGISTGLYYPYSNNPSGYATTGYVLNNTTSNQPFYFQSGSDGTVSKYYGLISESLNTNTTASLSAAVTLGGGQILLTGFITPSGEPSLLQIPAGLWLFNLYGSASSLTSTSYLVNSIYSYGTTGLETLLFTVTGGPLGSSDTLNSVYYISTGINLNTGDRLLSKIFALTNNALSTTITFNYQGAINPSHISSPLNYGYDYYTTKFVSQSQTGQFVTTGQTGSFGGGGNTGSLTGVFYPLNSNPNSYITTGQTGAFGGGTVTNNNTFYINSGTGAYIFNYTSTNGVNSEFISFPSNLGSNPYVIPTMNNTAGSESIFVQVSGIVSSGYWAVYSNTIDGINYVVTTLASTANSTGLATTVIINSGSSFSTGQVYIPPATITGNNITTTINWQTGDHFYITLTGNTNVVFTGTQDAMTIIVATQDTGKGYTVTFPTGRGNNFSGIKWAGGTGSIPVQTSGQTDIYTFTQFNTGIYGSYIQGF